MHRLVRSVTAGVFGAVAILLPAAGGASAAPAVSERLEFFVVELNACNGESIPMNFRLHVIGKDANKFSTTREQLHGTGVGDKGNVYVLNEKDTQISRDEFSFHIRAALVSKGGAFNELAGFDVSNEGVVTVTDKCVG